MKHSKGISKHGRFPEMATEGICVSLGADSANSADHSNMLRLIHIVAHIYKDFRMSQEIFPSEAVVEMATLKGAQALLMESEIGSIEPGKKADLVLFDRNHPEWRPLINPVNNLVYAATDRSIDSVFVSGRLVLKHGSLVGIDEQSIYDKVEKLSRKVMERAKVQPIIKWPLT
jgi:cytosine/adenosine deaminase-related metal-dependent hydrolase